MFYTTTHYCISSKTFFETYEEAVADAEKKASGDYEDCTVVVGEVKAMVKPEPLNRPIKTTTVSEGIKQLIEQKV